MPNQAIRRECSAIRTLFLFQVIEKTDYFGTSAKHGLTVNRRRS